MPEGNMSSSKGWTEKTTSTGFCWYTTANAPNLRHPAAGGVYALRSRKRCRNNVLQKRYMGPKPPFEEHAYRGTTVYSRIFIHCWRCWNQKKLFHKTGHADVLYRPPRAQVLVYQTCFHVTLVLVFPFLASTWWCVYLTGTAPLVWWLLLFYLVD